MRSIKIRPGFCWDFLQCKNKKKQRRLLNASHKLNLTSRNGQQNFFIKGDFFGVFKVNFSISLFRSLSSGATLLTHGEVGMGGKENLRKKIKFMLFFRATNVCLVRSLIFLSFSTFHTHHATLLSHVLSHSARVRVAPHHHQAVIIGLVIIKCGVC